MCNLVGILHLDKTANASIATSSSATIQTVVLFDELLADPKAKPRAKSAFGCATFSVILPWTDTA
jgi:hypothetical protein